jgi:Fe-S oxidoreductase
MAAHFTDGTSWGKKRSLPVEHLVAYLDRRLEDVTPPQPVSLKAPMLHDVCLLTRQVELGDQTRRVLDALVKEPVAEFDFNRKEAPCCGASGLYDRVAPEAASRCAGSRTDDLRKEGGQTVVCGSTDCARALGNNTEAGESALDIVELALGAFNLRPSESTFGDRGEE